MFIIYILATNTPPSCLPPLARGSQSFKICTMQGSGIVRWWMLLRMPPLSKTVFVEERYVITTFYWTIIIILLKFGLVECGSADAIKSIYLYDLGKTIIVLYTLGRRTHAHPLFTDEILSAIWFLTPGGIEIATETNRMGLKGILDTLLRR